MDVARTPWPLPFGLCRNRRSLLARQNLIDAIHFSLQAQATRDQTYIVADPAPLTLAEIVGALRAGCGRSPGLLPIPPVLIALAAKTMGRDEEWQRVGGALVADPGKLLTAGWTPSIETKAGLAAMARGA
jgi:UDP-glucose 4-epimerase